MTVRIDTASVSASRRGLLLFPVAIGCLYVLGGGERPQTPEIHVKEVLLDEARALVAAGALIIDVRDRAAYEARHIAGAFSAPISLLSAAIPASLQDARALAVLVYCGDGSTVGPKGTQLLNQAGFAQAVNLKPGMKGWASAGLPIEHGAGRRA